MKNEPKTLFLVVYKHWFDLMLSGIKKFEYRKRSRWILSRIENKNYDCIKFSNGYGMDKRFFLCEYKGFRICEKVENIFFDKYEIILEPGDIVIELGKILEKGNF
jgi:hypothetical protein